LVHDLTHAVTADAAIAGKRETDGQIEKEREREKEREKERKKESEKEREREREREKERERERGMKPKTHHQRDGNTTGCCGYISVATNYKQVMFACSCGSDDC
jgi:hypothetical protein